MDALSWRDYGGDEMHHKRVKPKNQRAGCLMFKPHKMNGAAKLKKSVGKVGFGKIRDEAHAQDDVKEPTP